jgi:hypothetical protein
VWSCGASFKGWKLDGKQLHLRPEKFLCQRVFTPVLNTAPRIAGLLLKAMKKDQEDEAQKNIRYREDPQEIGQNEHSHHAQEY